MRQADRLLQSSNPEVILADKESITKTTAASLTTTTKKKAETSIQAQAADRSHNRFDGLWAFIGRKLR
ncbi:MAG: hypothetical protein ACI8W8_000108 [Rhodothermales bacterium]|jgi:hypothetical protein